MSASSEERFCGCVSQAGLVVAVHFRAHDFLAVYGGHDIGGGWTMASGNGGKRSCSDENEEVNARTHSGDQFNTRFNLQPVHSCGTRLKAPALKDKSTHRFWDSIVNV